MPELLMLESAIATFLGALAICALLELRRLDQQKITRENVDRLVQSYFDNLSRQREQRRG